MPSKINFFVWMVALGRILTNENFRKHQLVVIDWCCMCKRVGETINHLLLHCLIARELLWGMVFRLFRISWVIPQDVVELPANWLGKFRKYRNRVIWNMASHCLTWGIWLERNAHIFERTERAIYAMFGSFERKESRGE